jgi:hypothetical protein
MSPARCVSYPKSGRTWLRFMLGALGHDAALSFKHDGFEFNDGAKPPHDFDVSKRLEIYREGDRVIYVERDPRDVMVSLYHQVTGRFRDFFGYEGDISAFIRDPYFGAGVLARFRAMWVEILSRRSFLTVRYEDIHADATREITRVLEYLGLPVHQEHVAAAVAAGSLENMRAVETSGEFDKPWLRPRNGFGKVRKGQVGSHAEELSEFDARFLADVFGL